jgi:hypothetical protein
MILNISVGIICVFIQLCLCIKHNLYDLIEVLRFNALKSSPQSTKECSKTKYLYIKGSYGRTANQFVQLSHGLWFSEMTNRTFILPVFGDLLLKSMDVKLLKKNFCIHDGNLHGVFNQDVLKLGISFD